jgi:hypothetical protein
LYTNVHRKEKDRPGFQINFSSKIRYSVLSHSLNDEQFLTNVIVKHDDFPRLDKIKRFYLKVVKVSQLCTVSSEPEVQFDVYECGMYITSNHGCESKMWVPGRILLTESVEQRYLNNGI